MLDLAEAMTDTEKTIAAILAELRSLGAHQIRSETLINDELGIDGDDAVDLLHLIERRFEIDTADFEFGKFFGPESMSIVNLVMDLLRGKKLRLLPLSVRQLGEYVDGKRATSKQSG
jgi:acyl carrier protein